MKQLKAAIIVIVILLLGGALFNWIQNELAFREELKSRPLPTELHPVVAESSEELVRRAADLGINVVITDGFRSLEEQEQLYAQGRSADGGIVTYAEAGESYHNYGLAIDFALRTDDGDIIWDVERDGNGNGQSDWFEVAEIGKDLGFEWGGDWSSFKDYPHLQMTFGLSIRELQNGWRPEDVMDVNSAGQ